MRKCGYWAVVLMMCFGSACLDGGGDGPVGDASIVTDSGSPSDSGSGNLDSGTDSGTTPFDAGATDSSTSFDSGTGSDAGGSQDSGTGGGCPECAAALAACPAAQACNATETLFGYPIFNGPGNCVPSCVPTKADAFGAVWEQSNCPAGFECMPCDNLACSP